jgi:geranylgeranyl diphosphate synthase type 3
MSNAVLPHEKDESLLEAFRYINSVPGKDVRGRLVDCFQLWLNVDDAAALDAIKDIIGDLHNASLLIDDIEDNSKLRRGIPVAHSIFGIPSVINTANYVYFLALQKCHALNNPKAMQVRSNELVIMKARCHSCAKYLSELIRFFVLRCLSVNCSTCIEDRDTILRYVTAIDISV